MGRCVALSRCGNNRGGKEREGRCLCGEKKEAARGPEASGMKERIGGERRDGQRLLQKCRKHAKSCADGSASAEVGGTRTQQRLNYTSGIHGNAGFAPPSCEHLIKRKMVCVSLGSSVLTHIRAGKKRSGQPLGSPLWTSELTEQADSNVCGDTVEALRFTGFLMSL